MGYSVQVKNVFYLTKWKLILLVKFHIWEIQNYMIEPSWTITVSSVLEYKKSSIFAFTFITHVFIPSYIHGVCVIIMKDKMHVPPLKSKLLFIAI